MHCLSKWKGRQGTKKLAEKFRTGNPLLGQLHGIASLERHHAVSI